MREGSARLYEKAMAWPAIAGPVATLTSKRVRILAYHDVSDPASFRRHLDEICRSYSPITADDLLDARAGRPLPARAVWITFDDGDPSVVREGLPLLQEYGLTATLFVCPGLIESGEPTWWDTVAEGVRRGIRPARWAGDWCLPSSVSRLKRLSDETRRAVVAELEEALRGEGLTTWGTGQLRPEELRSWLDGGCTLGNHTWDHPCLDQLTDDAQVEQIDRAQDWLEQRHLVDRPLFAYPNGDWTAVAEHHLARRGLAAGLLHDHRLAAVDDPPYRVSRLRVDVSAGVERLRAILSGVHTASFRAVGLVRRGTPRPARAR